MREVLRQSAWWGLSVLATASLALGSVACDEPGEKKAGGPAEKSREAAEKEKTQKLETKSWEAPAAVDLLEPPEEKRRDLDLSEPEKYPACRNLVEPDGEPTERFLPEHENKAVTLVGCDPEAFVRRRGHRYLAYSLPHGNSEARDMRIVAYGPDGRLLWAHRMDRSQYTDNFNANYRSSFIAPLPPHLVCAGTLWEGGTQAVCLERKSGKPRWGGELDFWSGISLQGLKTSLHGADISGITRRYPYSGVEMQRVDFEHLGGHSALYVTDGRRLFFAPKEGKPKRLTAYDLEALEPVWRVELPSHPDPGYDDFAFAGHDIVVIKIEEKIYGLDSTDGTVRWALEVGDDRPRLAASEKRFYLLLRRSEAPTRLFALEPASGEVEWYGPVPTGTLHLTRVEGALLVRSIRAVQQVRNLE